MWSSLVFSSAFAADVGLGLTGLVDLPGTAKGGFELPAQKLNCEARAEKVTTVGCDEVANDAVGVFAFGLAVPVSVPVSKAAALRVDLRLGLASGYTRGLCEAADGCVYNEFEGTPYTLDQNKYSRVHVTVPQLSVGVGPMVQFTDAPVAPHLVSTVGLGLQGVITNSDFFKEKGVVVGPMATAAAAFGVGSPLGSSGWFLDLGYAASVVPSQNVQANGSIHTSAFVVNGPRIDAGLVFGAPR